VSKILLENNKIKEQSVNHILSQRNIAKTLNGPELHFRRTLGEELKRQQGSAGEILLRLEGFRVMASFPALD
jgi:hypothetical protein